MPVRYKGLLAGVKYAVLMAQGFLVARRRQATMRRLLVRAISVRENLGLRRSLNTPLVVGADDQNPGPNLRVRSSATAEWNATSAGASELVAVEKVSFTLDLGALFPIF